MSSWNKKLSIYTSIINYSDHALPTQYPSVESLKCRKFPFPNDRHHDIQPNGHNAENRIE